MHGKTVVITGANSGIGEAAAAALADLGAEVALVCRSQAKGEAAMGRIRAATPDANLHLHAMDLASFASIRAGASAILAAHPRIDVLINNAGLMLPKRRQTVDGLEATLQINHLGPFLLTSLLAERLVSSAPARIINVSSEAHRGGTIRFDDLQSERRYGGFEAYGTSKLMNILHARSLAERLDPAWVTANALHPGVVATGFGQHETSLFSVLLKLLKPFLRSPKQGADTTVFLASEPEGAEETGMYFADRRKKAPSKAALDDELAEKLWIESERLTEAPPFPARRSQAGATHTEVS